MEEDHRLSLFVRLYRHRPQRHHTPRENYLSEAFATVLATDRKLLEAFFRLVANEHVPEMVCIDTQVSGKKGIFDVVIFGEDFYYLIEVKFTAAFTTGAVGDESHQLGRYAAELSQRPERRKGIITVTLRAPPIVNLPVNLFTIRWSDIMKLCQSLEASQDYSISEFLRGAFLELLKHLNVDRQIGLNGRLLWRCEVCGFETTGKGIHSHRNKHCREYGYLIERENKIRREAFLTRIAPHKLGIDNVVRAMRNVTKIEQANYDQSERVFDLLRREKVPRELWPYVGKHLQASFSKKAFNRFCEEISKRLQGVEPVKEPTMVWETYENIIRYLRLTENEQIAQQ